MMIDDLVLEIKERLTKVETKVDNLSSDINQINNLLQRFDDFFRGIQKEITSHNERLELGTKTFADIKNEINKLKQECVSRDECYNRHKLWRDWFRVVLGAMLGASLPMFIQFLKGG